MRNMHITHISQQGPTCGIYAIAMIINSLYDGKFDEQKLAYDIFEIATTSGISEMGELFDVNNVIKLLDWVADAEFLKDDETKLDYRIISFECLNDMREKIIDAFNSEKYLLIAYYSRKGRIFRVEEKKRNFKKTHWGAFYSLDSLSNISGEQGQLVASKKEVLRNKPLETMYASNDSLEGEFYWAKFLNRFSLWGKIDTILFSKTRNKKIKKKILTKYRAEEFKKLKQESHKLNLRGKMVEVGVTYR